MSISTADFIHPPVSGESQVSRSIDALRDRAVRLALACTILLNVARESRGRRPRSRLVLARGHAKVGRRAAERDLPRHGPFPRGLLSLPCRCPRAASPPLGSAVRACRGNGLGSARTTLPVTTHHKAFPGVEYEETVDTARVRLGSRDSGGFLCRPAACDIGPGI